MHGPGHEMHAQIYVFVLISSCLKLQNLFTTYPSFFITSAFVWLKRPLRIWELINNPVKFCLKIFIMEVGLVNKIWNFVNLKN